MKFLTILGSSALLARGNVFDDDFGEEEAVFLHNDNSGNLGQDYYYGYVDYSYFDMMAYQDNLNYDYMSYDRYDVFKP